MACSHIIDNHSVNQVLAHKKIEWFIYNALPTGRLWNKQTLYAQKWEDRISEEFVSKYTVFSHKGGVRILEDNPHAHPRARVFLYGHLCFFLSRLPTLQCPLTSLAWGEKFLCSLRVIHLIWGPHKFSIFGESGSCSRLMTQASFIATCLLNANRLQKPSAPPGRHIW